MVHPRRNVSGWSGDSDFDSKIPWLDEASRSKRTAKQTKKKKNASPRPLRREAESKRETYIFGLGQCLCTVHISPWAVVIRERNPQWQCRVETLSIVCGRGTEKLWIAFGQCISYHHPLWIPQHEEDRTAPRHGRYEVVGPFHSLYVVSWLSSWKCIYKTRLYLSFPKDLCASIPLLVLLKSLV